MKTFKISIAGLGNVGSNVVQLLSEYNQLIIENSLIKFEIIGVSAKNSSKKRICNIKSYKWYDNPLNLISNSKPDILIELIGHENGISYKLVKTALQKKINIITANKALIAKHGNELFHLADQNNVLLLFEASVAGCIPIIRTIKQSLFYNKINKISGILNGTTNYILSEMHKSNSSFDEILIKAQKSGYAESDPKNDIEGIDSAHKITILSVLCFGVEFDFNKVIYKGISNLSKKDIKFAKKLNYIIKLVSSSEIINNKIISVVEPTLVKNNSKLANIDSVQNGIRIETEQSNSLFLEGEGAGGKSTASAILSDLLEITKSSKFSSLGFSTSKLKKINTIDYDERICSYYLRMIVKDIPGVLAKITSYMNQEGISIETIIQLPEQDITNVKSNVPIIITTHETKFKLLNKVKNKIENLNFVLSKLVIMSIDKTSV